MLRLLLMALLTLTLGMRDAAAADVTLKAADGTKLHGDYTAVTGSQKGVVLVHMVGRSASDWKFLSARLNSAGLTTLAVDLRGHGANVPAGTTPPTLDDATYGLMVQDVAAAVGYLRAQGVKDVHLVGASIGANLSLRVAAQDAEVRSVVMLSPGMNYKGVTVTEALAAYGARPLLVVASQEDNYSLKSAQFIDGAAAGVHHLELYNGAGHGTKMLNKAPELEGLIVSWLLGTWNTSTATTTQAPVELNTGDTSKVQSTGQKLGE